VGQDVAARVFSRADRQRYREKVRVCLDAFARMLAESRFEPARGSFGLEIELNLTGDNGNAGDGQRARARRDSPIPHFQTELYNDHGDVAEFHIVAGPMTKPGIGLNPALSTMLGDPPIAPAVPGSVSLNPELPAALP
jgi:hypothetical protein